MDTQIYIQKSYLLDTCYICTNITVHYCGKVLVWNDLEPALLILNKARVFPASFLYSPLREIAWAALLQILAQLTMKGTFGYKVGLPDV